MMASSLSRHDFSAVTGGELPVYWYSQPGPPGPPLAPGSYTAYGDVTWLLAQTDDLFAVFGAGDEVALQFKALTTPPAPGLRRLYAFQSSGYYKENIPNPEVPFTVDPLPFRAMSNFPYPATEHYPTDRVHEAYLRDWNTRVVP